jgi:PAS domain-containing protein
MNIFYFGMHLQSGYLDIALKRLLVIRSALLLLSGLESATQRATFIRWRPEKPKYGNTLLRVPAVRKDGCTISIAFSVTMIFDDHQQPIAIAAFIRDETERFQEERRLKEKLATYERANNDL